jgi:arylsulfatase A-like enzyme
MNIRFSILLFVAVIFLSCSKDDGPNINPETTQSSPNILLIIADDMGKDAAPGYSEGSVKPTVPNIESIMNAGIKFNNFWTAPVCSPTRATILTGKYGYRTNVLNPGDIISESETSLQAYINQETNNAYATSIIGKWHLSGGNSTINPEDWGIDYYAGIFSGGVNSYDTWSFNQDGVSITETSYVTEKLTDLAIDWVANQTKPWFLWMAYNAPHTPFHLPPAEMHSQGNLTDSDAAIASNPLPYYMAMIEAMDYQIGRLLESMTTEERDNTIIIFIGDNGTPNRVAQSPYTNSTVKGSIYQGGVNMPMYISGKGVSRISEEDALINSSDLFATIANIAEVNVNEINDSKNFTSLLSTEGDHRDFAYVEVLSNNKDEWGIRNSRYKLIERSSGEKELYDLDNDPYENMNLLLQDLSLEASNAKTVLEAELLIIRN